MTRPIAQAIDLLERLVGFDTTSVNPNLPCAEFIRDYLATLGVEVHLLPAADGIHANLFATIGPAGEGGVALSGHMDVVPVTGQPWDSDPFKLTKRNGHLYGRGTADMKGFLACALAMVPKFAARRLHRPIHLAFSYDEEVGCTGVKPMIAELGRSLPKPRLVVVGEPTLMTVVDAHKGGYRYKTTIIGKSAHSSKPQLGASAIFAAADLALELRRIEARERERHVNPRFAPPFSTISIGMISGGIAHNIIPPFCEFWWGVRALPGLDVEQIERVFARYAEREVLPEMRRVSPDCAITTELVGELPPFAAANSSPAVELALKLAGQNETFAVDYGTEASHFEAAGMSSVIIGPGSIDQAHQPNEFVAISELEKCLAFLDRLAGSLSA